MTANAKPTPAADPADPDELIPIERVEDIPESFATEAEEAEYWSTHSLGRIWDQLKDVTDNPPWGDTPPRPTPIERQGPQFRRPTATALDPRPRRR